MDNIFRNKMVQGIGLGIAICIVVVGAFFGIKSLMGPGSLKEQLTGQKKYQPPSSASTDSAFAFPTIFMRVVGDSVRGLVSIDPTKKIDAGTELGVQEMVNRLRVGHQTLAQNPGPRGVPNAFNLVLDKSSTYGQAMLGIYIGVNGTFQMPFLITAEGNQHSVEPPRMHPQFGPMGWAAWIWWLPDQRIKWVVWPDSLEGNFTFHVLPAKNGKPDIEGLRGKLRTAMDGKAHIPPPQQRLIGFWGYDSLPYESAIQFFDVLRYPKTGEPLCSRLTLMEGEMMSPPADSVCVE
ncbi:MAG TPA: hypothetical protein PLG27_07330 [Candidatus Latescibacteria bacterium]|nr:hypothetical protein [Candidatus Latescibacterota bacterium]HOM57544.1 hypothetical protein [Candidatus Latescibacterota bacterium]HOS63522.1 hypothetical protein [Candidatus Latescibacterota bacterium]HOT36203.1 hypothetical protein [Candidatus Latescibacterota bacterium]HPC45394.1 hypothetical protein [Candidatus Latescibacterota bacterium]